MPLLTRFDTPGGLQDVPPGSALHEQWQQAWHATVAELNADLSGGAWFDPLTTDVEVVALRSLSWIGCPRSPVFVQNRDDRPAGFAAAEDRSQQFEYFEWRVFPGDGRPIEKVVFTTETPEYWTLLAEQDEATLLARYRELVGDQVQLADLKPDGTYDPLNRWNTELGIVHFVNGINNLGAAMGLAKGGAATGSATGEGVPRDNFETPVLAGHAADDYISRETAVLARAGFAVTVADPVGLYIEGWDDTGWTRPDGTPVGDYWRITRGRPGAVLRLEYEVPREEGFVVGDISIGGRRITHGGQLAEHISSVLPVVVARRTS